MADVRPAGTGVEGARAISNGARVAGTAGEVRGVATGGPFIPEHCQAQKQSDGSACSARPVKGTDLCFGHTRSKSGATV